jgi:putative DNA primase/helicase
MPLHDPVQDILGRLGAVKQTSQHQWQARCPAHEDEHASLCIGRGDDGRALIKCQAGCSSMQVCSALDLPMRALFPPNSTPASAERIVGTYDYHDADGNLLFQCVRYEPKDFRQRRPDGNGGWTWKINGSPRVLYRLPQLLKADPAQWVFVVEGEKDVDNLFAAGLVATTNPMGAGKWGKLSDDSALHGRRVAILPDKDEVGRNHARDVAGRLQGKVTELKILELPGDGKDASDWLTSGGTADELLALTEAAEPYQPSQDRPSDAVPQLQPGQFLNDLYGNADRFVQIFGQDVHWCESRGKWYVWDGCIWQPDAVREVQRMAELTMRAMLKELAEDEHGSKWAAKCNRDAKHPREMLEAVKHRTAIPIEQLDRHPWLLGVRNGVIDLKTGALLPHDRRHLITTLCPAEYDPEARCPRWDEFLLEIMGGNVEMGAALQRLAGYFLTGDISVQILPIFYGKGGNGKNVFLDTIMGIMGPHAEEAPDGLVTAKVNEEHPTEIADLYGKRLVVASETEENKKLRIGLVKKITGNKYLKGRFMRQDYFQFERTHKTVLVTNNKPVVTETSHAIWRRLRLIPFTVTIPEDKQDRQLTEKLVAEWPGILAWAVRGCLAWQAHQCDLEFPEQVQAATEEYRGDSDHVVDFISERCVDWRANPEQKMRTPKERLYLAYCAWCRDVGEDVLIRNAFNSRLRSHGFEDKPLRVEGRVQKCWMHMTLKGADHE